MKPAWGMRTLCALTLLAAGGGPAEAAWCNALPTSCLRKRCCAPACPPAPAARCAPPCGPAPAPVARGSYFYQQVTSYQYRSYYDPCTCRCRQAAVPVTSYRLRRCGPIRRLLGRCCGIPATPCCPPAAAVVAVPVPAATLTPPVAAPFAPPPAAPVAPVPAPPPPPAPPGAVPAPVPDAANRSFPLPPASGSSYRPAPPASRPVRLDRVASSPAGPLDFQGQVLHPDRAPASGAQVLFVSTTRHGARQSATADVDGRFRVHLPAGEWLVYLREGGDGLAFRGKIDPARQTGSPFTLVGR